MLVKFTLRDSKKAKVSEGQWIIGGHEKAEIGIELFMPLLKDALLILQSSPPMVITSQIASFFFSFFFSFQRRFRNPSDLMRTFAFQPLGPFLEVDGVDMSYEATVGAFFFPRSPTTAAGFTHSPLTSSETHAHSLL